MGDYSHIKSLREYLLFEPEEIAGFRADEIRRASLIDSLLDDMRNIAGQTEDTKKIENFIKELKMIYENDPLFKSDIVFNLAASKIFADRIVALAAAELKIIEARVDELLP